MEAYYFNNGDGSFYIGVVDKRYKDIDPDNHKKRVPWLTIIKFDTGEEIFHWPEYKLKADRVSDERLVELGLIEQPFKKRLFGVF